MTAYKTFIQEHNLRRAWPNEASDFTPWLNEGEAEYLVVFKCRCSKDLEAFHNHINHYFNKRVFKNK